MTSHLRISTVAERTGLSEGVLRMWERRYGFPRPRRTGGNYRTYSEEEIELINQVVVHMKHGLAASEAIGTVLAAPSIASGVDVGETKARFWALVHTMDQEGIDALLNDAKQKLTPVRFCDDLLLPLLQEMTGKLDVAREHYASNLIRQQLRSVAQGAWAASTGPCVLLACPQGEEHEGGLLGIGVHLRYAGWRVLLLGANTPVDALAQACKTARPRILAMSFIQPRKKSEVISLIERIVKAVAPVRVVVGGPIARRFVDEVEETGAFYAQTAEELMALAV